MPAVGAPSSGTRNLRVARTTDTVNGQLSVDLVVKVEGVQQ